MFKQAGTHHACMIPFSSCKWCSFRLFQNIIFVSGQVPETAIQVNSIIIFQSFNHGSTSVKRPNSQQLKESEKKLSNMAS
mmetsp:Transcript_37483/g.78501  ORF Transcript_37483/g.78501 Transcript_37483/m.78501 type:complete len:80 (+) Transcript_37483:168-407(+)